MFPSFQMTVKCRCDSKPCAGGCPCYKAGSQCNSSCHLGKEWSSVPCLNTNYGIKVRTIRRFICDNWIQPLNILILKLIVQVKGLKPAEVRQALCDAGLSPVGDKNELLKVHAPHKRLLEC